jgi:hypothetical protein
LLIIAGANLHIAWLMMAGLTLAELDFRRCFLGVLGILMPQVEPHQGEGLIAVYYLESYLA